MVQTGYKHGTKIPVDILQQLSDNGGMAIEFDDYGNPLQVQSAPVEQAEAMPDLEQLGAPELRTLLKRLFAAVYGVGLMSEDDIAQAFMDRLAIDGLTSKDARITLANCNAWLDRVKGKAVQKIEQQIVTATIDPAEAARRIVFALRQAQENAKLINQNPAEN